MTISSDPSFPHNRKWIWRRLWLKGIQRSKSLKTFKSRRGGGGEGKNSPAQVFGMRQLIISKAAKINIILLIITICDMVIVCENYVFVET